MVLIQEVSVQLTLADLTPTPIRFLESRASDQSHGLLPPIQMPGPGTVVLDAS